MKSFMTMVRSNMKVQAVLSIVLGLFLVWRPQATTLTVVYLLALYVAVTGAASIVSYVRHRDVRTRPTGVLASGVFFLVVALLIFLFPEAVAGIFSLVLGILLAIGGLVNVVRSIELRAYRKNAWMVMLLGSTAIAVGGIVIIINPFDTTVTFVLVLGVLLVIKGVIDLMLELALPRMRGGE